MLSFASLPAVALDPGGSWTTSVPPGVVAFAVAAVAAARGGGVRRLGYRQKSSRSRWQRQRRQRRRRWEGGGELATS